jgi:hypothetical protein
MNLREILDYVVSTQPGQWYSVPYAERALMPFTAIGMWTGGDQRWGLEIEAHYTLAINLEHPEISLAWGLKLDEDLEFPALEFPDRNISSSAADIMLNGALIHRAALLNIDGGRARLPMPGYATVATDDPTMPLLIGDKVSDWEVAFVRLLEGISPGIKEFDRYFERSGFMTYPGHPLGDEPPARRD